MAVSKWLTRKSFDEAAEKAEKIKIATKIKEAKNAGLFTASQEKLREELGLLEHSNKAAKQHCENCNCFQVTELSPASRIRIRIRTKRNPSS